MMIVTSEADNATGVAFPVGRGLSTMLQHAKSPEQRQSILKTIGHNSRYVTHDLIDQKDGREETEVIDETACGCPYLEPTATWSQQSLLNLMGGYFAVESDVNDYSGRDDPEDPDAPNYKPITLTSVPINSASSNYAANYPFLVVKTDEKLIPNHNAIYNESFTTFTQAFILSHIVGNKRLPADKVQQQCFADETGGGQHGRESLLPM